jgi:hypothetical protein
LARPVGGLYLAWCTSIDKLATIYADHPHVFGADDDAAALATTIKLLPNATLVVADPTRWPFLSRWPLSESGEMVTFALADFGLHPYPYDAWRSFIKHAQVADDLVVFFTDGQPVAVQRGGRWRDPDGEHRRAADPDTQRPDNRTTIPIRTAWWARTVFPWWCNEVEQMGYRRIVTRSYWDRQVLHWTSVITRK